MDHFDKFLKELSDQLTIKNIEEAKFLYRKKLPLGRCESIKDQLSFLRAMEQVKLISEHDISELYTLFELFPRKDLIPVLDEFKNNYSTSIVETKSPSEHVAESSYDTRHLPYSIDTLSHSITNTLNVSDGHNIFHGCSNTNGHASNGHNGLNVNNGRTIGASVLCMPNNDLQSFVLPEQESKESSSSISLIDDDRPEEYEMKKPIHGQCMIFNNTFVQRVILPNGKCLNERRGTEKDVESLVKTFMWLRFDVSVSEDKTANEIIEILEMMASQDDQAGYECFVCCILSHGYDGGMYGSDGSTLRSEELRSVFERDEARYLFDKPKLFFIQACQGDQDGRGRTLVADSPIAQDHLDILPRDNIAVDADFLFFNATTSGKVSWRCPEEGTWFIQTLCSVLQKKAFKWSLLNMLLRVNAIIAEKTEALPEGGNAKQMSDMGRMISLRKNLYFHPPHPYEYASRQTSQD